MGIEIIDYFQSTTTFRTPVRQRRLFLREHDTSISYFEDKGRLHVYHNKIKIDHCRDILYQASLSEMPPIGIERDSAIIDLAYLIAGLVTITQSHLVHHMFQGVERTDPTEWSNSRLLQWRQSCIGCSTNSHSSQERIIVSFQRHKFIHVRTAPQHLTLLHALSLFKMAFTTYTYKMLFCEQLGHILIIFQRH